MSSLTGLLYGALVIYLGGWYLGKWTGNFSLLLFILTVVTLGLAWLLAFLTRWLINTLLLMLTDRLSEHLKIDSFGWAAAGAFLISLVGVVLSWIVPWA